MLTSGTTAHIRETLAESLFFVPALCCAVALGLAISLVEIDKRVGPSVPFLFPGGPDGARSLLSAVITAMISFTGLVFSITVVALQLASSQFSPRVLRTFLRSRTSQLALGVFTATFVYSIVVLREVRGSNAVAAGEFVPQLSVTTTSVLVLISVGMFLVYIQHMARAVRVTTIIKQVGDETASLIERGLWGGLNRNVTKMLPAGVPAGDVTARRAGVVVRVDVKTLVKVCRDADARVRIVPVLGEFVPKNGLIAHLIPSERPEDRPGREPRDTVAEVSTKVAGAVQLGDERTMEQDVAFGLRQLVDIAERALSPGINDPTTAMQVVDALHDLLRRLAARENPTTRFADDEGVLRVELAGHSFARMLDLAVDEIAANARGMPRVTSAVLQRMLHDVRSVARPEHRPVIDAKYRTVAAELAA